MPPGEEIGAMSAVAAERMVVCMCSIAVPNR
jgi:hypothetical protein